MVSVAGTDTGSQVVHDPRGYPPEVTGKGAVGVRPAPPADLRARSAGGHRVAELGFDSKRKLAEHLAERALLPAAQHWDNREMQTLMRPLAVAGVEP